MNGPLREGFIDACRKEIETLIQMGAWDVVKREKWMNVLPSSQVLKVKRFPDGLVRKLKSRLILAFTAEKQPKRVVVCEAFAAVTKAMHVSLIVQPLLLLTNWL